jgi:hypothetical protein
MAGRRYAIVLALTPFLCASALAQSPKVGDPPESLNMRLVGMSDLQARSAYQPTIHRQGERIIAYIGHHGGTPDVPKPVNKMTGQAEFNGTSILDVTDPANPKYLKHIPGLEGNYEEGGAQMVRVCDGKGLSKGDAAKTYMLRVFGGKAHQIWDVTDPANPAMLAELPSGRDTHKNWWECDTGIAYLVSGISGWRTRRMMQVYDLSDPAHPKHIRDFGLAGQQPGTEGAVPTELHGAISSGPQGGRIYIGYGTNKGGVLQILDREKLLNGAKEPTPENLRAPVIGELQMSPLVGAHTTYPLGKVRIPEFASDKFGAERDMVMIVDEALVNECGAGEARQMVWFVDVTIEKYPMVVASYTPAAGNFCERGGRFGAHSSNESMAPVFFGKLAFVTFFNGGVRAIDIRNPYRPKEAGYFIPSITEATDKRCIKVDGKDRCKIAIQSNNVETDDRGYIYVVDRANTGLHILEVTGEARAIAGIK